MIEFQDKLILVGTSAGLNVAIKDDIEEVKQQITVAEHTLEIEHGAMIQNIEQFEIEKLKLESMPKPPIWENPFGRESPEFTAQRKMMEELQRKIKSNEKNFSLIKMSLEKLNEQLECLELRASGNACSWEEKWDKAKSAVSLRKRIAGLSNDIEQFADDTIDLLVSLLLRSIVLPLLLLYIVLRYSRRALRMNL